MFGCVSKDRHNCGNAGGPVWSLNFYKPMKMLRKEFVCLMAVLLLLESSARCEADALYHFLKEIPVAGDQGWGTLTIDEAARRLYITRDNKIDLVDLAKDKVVGEITNTPGVHG